MRQVLPLLIIVSGIAFCPPVIAQNFPGIETLMTPVERQAAGIDALSAQQLEALNAWLGNYLGDEPAESTPVVNSIPATPPTPAADPAPDQREYGAPPPEFQPIVSTIKGEFRGWTGNTRFELENGQIYVQRRPGRWRVNLVNPEVRITKNILGAFDMEVVSEGRSIGVRRVR